MERLPLLVFILFTLSRSIPAQPVPVWKNPAVFEKNQTLPHATLMPFPTLSQALENDRKASPYCLSLNGSWQFHWAENPAEAPSAFPQGDLDEEKWTSIEVPSNWQMQDFGYPLFRNIGLPFPNDPPDTPADFNPVGSYFRTFELPTQWLPDKQVFLHFEGVHSASFVWINGREVGYNQGGMEPAEYDVTNMLKPGRNTIAVQVLRFSDGAFLEDQDTWRLSGIYRDVYLMATPKVHIRDFYLTTDLDDEYQDATLRIEAELRNYRQQADREYTLRVQLYDQQQLPVFSQAQIIAIDELPGNSHRVIAGAFPVDRPEKWSAEKPYLYTVTMELLDERKQVIEILSSRLGFREVEVKNQAIYINGVPVKFNGVNSHMMHPETGHAMDTATMRQDLLLMKRFNINCVRTSHYPPNVEYLDLADELGMYIFDETGDEAHAYIQLSHDSNWRAQYLDRMRKMVYRDRNHPSVVVWSAGNESGPGDNICALIAEGKRIDPSRPAWMYGGNRDDDPRTNPIKCEDIVGPRYLQPFRLQQRFAKSDDPRPSFMDEYLAATGNSLGALDEYWDLIYRYPRLTGGAVWDWISPGITQTVTTTPDDSPHTIHCALMNKALLKDGPYGQALFLSGHDDWLEIYRDPALDIDTNQLTLSFWVRPEIFNKNAYFITKGDYQYGIIQPSENQLEFYVHTQQRVAVQVPVPEDWVGNWHQVTGTYDGTAISLYIDGQKAGEHPCHGRITNGPYPVNIGKSSEIRDSHRGPLCHATIDRVRIYNRAVTMKELENESDESRSQASLWLDFESTQTEGTYYSVGIPGRTYGLVWPDRRVQPELWQLKKSPQPVAVSALDLAAGQFEVFNRYHFRNLNELKTTWTMTADGQPIQEGTLALNVAPLRKKILHIPFQQPVLQAGARYHLTISLRLPDKTKWAEKGHEVAWEQFELPFYLPPEPSEESGGSLRTEENDGQVLISGEQFTYTISKETGCLQSMVFKDKELIAGGPQFNVWRAPLANEVDSWSVWQVDIGQTREGMGREIANGWRSIGLNDLRHSLNRLEVHSGTKQVIVETEVSAHSNNFTTGFLIFYRYTITREGQIRLDTRVSPRGKMTHWLPKVGLKMQLPTSFEQLQWFGRGPFETYPDRKTGAKIGLYTSSVEEEYVPYLIPQDYGNKTDVYWLSITDEAGSGLHISGDQPFNSSAHVYDTDHLTRALYPFQLRRDKLVTLHLDHQVSGVGDTSASVLNPYRVLPSEVSFTFFLQPK